MSSEDVAWLSSVEVEPRGIFIFPLSVEMIAFFFSFRLCVCSLLSFGWEINAQYISQVTGHKEV